MFQQPMTPAQQMQLQRMNLSNGLGNMRLYANMLNRPPQMDLSGISDIGSGIAKGVQNLANSWMYNRNQNQLMDYMRQEEAAQAAQAQAQAQAQAAAQQQQFNAAKELLSAPVTQALPYQGAPLAGGTQTTLQPLYSDGVIAAVAANPTVFQGMLTKRIEPTQQAMGGMQVGQLPGILPYASPRTPAQENIGKLIFGSDPVTARDLAAEDMALKLNQEDLYKKKTENSVLPQVVQQDLKGKMLGNQSTELSNYGKNIENQYLAQEKQLALLKGGQDSQKNALDIESGQKKLEMLNYLRGPEAQAQIQDAINRGDTNTLKAIQAKASLYKIDLGLTDKKEDGSKVSVGTSDGKVVTTTVRQPDGSTVIYDKNGKPIQTITKDGQVILPQVR